MAPPFSMYSPEDDEDITFRPQREPLSFGLGDLSSSLDYGLDSTDTSIDRPALLNTLDDTQQEFGAVVNPDFNKSRNLLESSNEAQLSRIRQLTDRALRPNYQMSPSEAFATTVLSILPAAAGYMIGGSDLAAQTSKIDAGSAYLKNLNETDQQERAAAMQAAQLESQNYRQGVGNQQQMERFLMAQQQRDELQNERIRSQQELQRERLGNAAEKSERERNLKQQSYTIDGLETRPGDVVPTEKFKMALPLQVDYQELTTAAKDFKKKLIDPSASLEDQRAAYYRMIDKVKKSNNYGANFSAFEQKLAAAGLPPIHDITSPQMISDRMLAEIRGLDPVGKIDEFMAVTTREHYAKLKPIGYYPPGTFQQEGGGDIMDSLIQVESAGNPNAVSPKGAFGLTQLMPAGTKGGLDQVAQMWGVDPYQLEEEARTSPRLQKMIGETYLKKYLLPKYGGDMEKALQAYNGGEGRVASGNIPRESRDYSAKVLRLQELEARRPR